MAGQGADQRAVAPLRPQVRVDREDHAFRRSPRAHRDQAGRELRRGAQRGIHVARGAGVRAGRDPGPVTGGRGHEDDVDVAGVVQLAAAALAHGEHGDPARRGAGGQLGAGDRERGAQHRGGDVGELARDLLGAGHAGDVPRGQVQDVPLVRGAQGRGRVRPVQRRQVGDRVIVQGAGAHRVQQRGPQLARGGPPDRVGAAQQVAVVRMPDQVVGEAGADPQHGGQALPEPRLRAQRGPDIRGVGPAVGTRDPGQPEQGEVGIGGGGDGLQQRVVHGRAAETGLDAGWFRRADVEGQVRGDKAFCGGRVGEPHPGQPPLQGRRPHAAHPGAHAMTLIRMARFPRGAPGGCGGGRAVRGPGRPARRPADLAQVTRQPAGDGAPR